MGIDSFQIGGVQRPTDEISPKKKQTDKRWNADWAKFIWNYGDKNRDTPYSQRFHYSVLRSYGAGRQDTRKYKTKFQTGEELDNSSNTPSEYDSGLTKQEERTGLTNMNWDIVSVFPKFRRILLGKFSTLDHAITAMAIDRQSGDEREEEKWQLYAKKILDGFLKRVYKRRGAEYKSPAYLPDDHEELELFDSMGGFKLKQEQAMELMIQHSFDISDWDKNIKDQIFGDLIDLGIASVKDDYDSHSGKVKQIYLDPPRLIVPRAFYNDSKNMPWWGYEEYYTIAQLAQKGFSEKDLAGFASVNSSRLGNSSYQEAWYNERNNSAIQGSTQRTYDDFNIKVLTCEMRSTDKFNDVKHTNQYGKTMIHNNRELKKESDKEIKTKKGKTIKNEPRTTHVNNIYQVKWIVGTDQCFEYGIKNGQPREGKDVEMSCHVIKLPGQSMVENSITHLDDLQMSFLSLQNAKANARPSGMAINFDSINNISSGGKKMSPLSVLEIYRKTGDLIFKVTPMGTSGFGNNLGKPMEELVGGIGPIVKELMEQIIFRLDMIRESTGINSIADASNPDPNQSVGGGELALAATNNAIRPLYKGYITLKEKIARNTCLRTQLVLKYNDKAYEAYYPVLGKMNLKVLTIGQKAQEASYTTKIEAIPTEQEKRDLKVYIQEAMRTGKNGVAALRPSHGLMLNEMLSANVPLKKIRVMLGFLENKDRQIQDLKEKENYQLQGQIKQESDQAAAQLAQETKQFETDENIREHQAKSIIDVGVKVAGELEKDKALATLEHFHKLAEDTNKARVEARYREEKEPVVQN